MGSVQEEQSWQHAAKVKRQERDASIPKEWRLDPSLVSAYDLSSSATSNVIALDLVRKSGILSDLELEITEQFSASELVISMVDGQFTSEQVTLAFSKRAAIAQQLTNCLTEMFFDRALERARYVDEYLKTNKKPIGPLHGLPVSLKDSFDYKGIPSTLGYISSLKHPAPETNSVLTDELLSLGAVLYVKTNVPQALMTCDTHNNVFGRTLNPHNLSLTAGGSSGGESALVAFRGSLMGVGTDLGGSIRMPAACTGVYGLKPSATRIPCGAQASEKRLYHPVDVVAGPLCNHFDDIELFMKAVISTEPWRHDPCAMAVSWRLLPALERPLTIGVLAVDPKYPLHPPVRRALSTAAEKLFNAGHKIVNLIHDPDLSISKSNDAMFKYYATDPDQETLKVIDANEPMVPSLFKMDTIGSLGDDRCPTLRELGDLNKFRVAMIDHWRKVFEENQLDVILAPPSQCTAVEHDCWNWIPYTTAFNLTNLPGIILPYTKVSKALDPEPWAPGEGCIGPRYNPEILDGVPCTLQVLGRTLQEEELLRAAKVIDNVLKA